MEGLNLGIVGELELRLPPLHTQDRFLEALAAIRRAESRAIAAAGVLEMRFASLLHRAFSGEL